MLKFRRQSHILSWSLLVLLLIFGCSQQSNQKAPTDTAVNEPLKQVEPQQVEQPEAQEALLLENAEAKQKMAFARSHLKMAQKGIMSYSQMVVLCRDVIKQYPGTPYEREARTLLGQVPEDQRSQFNITDEELGL